MNDTINNFNQKELSGRDARLWKEWKELDTLCAKRKASPVPREPIFGYLHKMSIVLPNNYPPADGNPIFTFRSDIWHPNIRYSGSFKGHVCLTIKEMGVLASLKDLVLRVERYLKYQLYHAQNTYPYPEDQNVAEWVREEGEPNGWTRFGQDMTESESDNSTRPTDKNEGESAPSEKTKIIARKI